MLRDIFNRIGWIQIRIKQINKITLNQYIICCLLSLHDGHMNEEN